MKPSWKFVIAAVVIGWVSGALFQPAIAPLALPAIKVSFVLVSLLAVFCFFVGTFGSFYENDAKKTKQPKKEGEKE